MTKWEIYRHDYVESVHKVWCLDYNVRVQGLRSYENQGVPELRDDCFQNKYNAEIGHYRQTLCSQFKV